MGTWRIIELSTKWTKHIFPSLHVVDVDSFGDPILAVMDDSNIEHYHNNNSAMVTVVLPFAKAWPRKFMSAYRW